MAASPSFDHIALTVPNLDEQVERLTKAFGMEVKNRSDFFALVVDPGSGVKFELSRGYLHFAVSEERELFWGGPTRCEFWCTLFRRSSLDGVNA